MQPWLDGMLPPQIQWKITGKKAKVTDVCCSIIMAVKLQAYLSFFQKAIAKFSISSHCPCSKAEEHILHTYSVIICPYHPHMHVHQMNCN